MPTDRTWLVRQMELAKWVPAGSTVLDLGCGKGDLQGMISASCKYIGWDTAEIDLNAAEWPPLPPHNVAVLSGVFEWLDDPGGVLARMTAPIVLASYSAYGQPWTSDERVRQGWRSHLTPFGCMLAIDAAGYSLRDLHRLGGTQWLARLRRRPCSS